MKNIPIERIKVFDGLGIVWAAASGTASKRDLALICKQASSKLRKVDAETKKLKQELFQHEPSL